MSEHYNFSLDVVLQMLLVFEGISFWRLSDFVMNNNQSSGKGLKEELNIILMRLYPGDSIPWKQIVLLFMAIFTWPIRIVLNWGVKIFKHTPLVCGVVIPIGVIGHFVGWGLVCLTSDFVNCLALFILWFILIKLFVNLLALVCNWFKYKLISVETPVKIEVERQK